MKIKDEDILRNIAKQKYYSEQQFISDAKCWIKAIKESRMVCVIKSISSNGMSRVFKYTSCEKTRFITEGKKQVQHNYRSYSAFLEVLDYKETKNHWGCIRVGGCGMDMNFGTTYNIMHQLKNLKFITNEQCGTLAQKTPNIL